MSSIAEMFKCAAILQQGTTGDTVTEVDYLPTAGVGIISVVCPVVMGHATIVTLTLSTADDAAATNTTALTDNVPIWLYNSTYPTGARQTDAKAGSVPAANFTNGILTNFLVFEVPSILVPSGKYLGVHCNAGNASNVYSAFILEDTYYNG